MKLFPPFSTLNISNVLIRFTLLLALSLIFNNNAKASHICGGEISYQCTATPGVFNVTLKLYKDCNGIQLCSNCPTSLSSSCTMDVNILGAAGSCIGANLGTQSLVVITAISGLDVIQLCAAAGNSICSNCGTRSPGTFSPGIEIYVFVGQVNLSSLSASCCMVSVGYGACCRNGNITTLNNPSSTSFYTEAIINRCASPCNSSPTFTNDAILIMCAGQDFTYNLGAIDPDGDSLSYTFGPTLTASNTPASYASPYSATAPFPYLGSPALGPPLVGINIDAVTGDVRFRPMGSFVSNLVIVVKQWSRNISTPVLLGTSQRDIQIYSQYCFANNPPVLRTYDSTSTLSTPQPRFTYGTYAGRQLCFTISAWDNTGAYDTTYLTWNAPSNLVANGATFVKLYNNATRNINGPKFDSMRFCWTPPVNMASTSPYYFTVTAIDKACPITAKTTHSFAITVLSGKPVVVNTSAINMSNNTVGVGGNITDAGLSSIIKSGVVFSLTPNPILATTGVKDSTTIPVVGFGTFAFNLSSLTQNTKYYYRAYASNNNGVSYANQDSFITRLPLILNLPDTTVAFKQDSILLDAGAYNSYSWNTGDTTRTIWVINAGFYKVNVTNSPNSSGSDSTIVLFIKGIQQKDTSVCLGTSVNLNANSNNTGKIKWSTGDTINAIAVTPMATTVYKSNIKAGSFSFNDSIKITTRNLPAAILTYSKRGLCLNDSVTLNAPGGTNSFTWYKNNIPQSGANTNLFKVTSRGDYKFQTTDLNGCKNTSASVTIFSAPLPKARITFAADSVQCLSGNSFSFTDATTIDSSSFTRFWKLGDGGSSLLPGVQHTYLTAGSFLISLTSLSSYGCIDSTLKTITVKPNPVVGIVTGPQTSLLPAVQYTYSVAQQTNHTYNWALTNGNILSGQGSNAIMMKWVNSGAGNLKVKVSNPQNCMDSTSLNITVGSSGIADIANMRTLNIYPNPNNGNFTLSVYIEKGGLFNLEIYNAEGARIHNMLKDLNSGSNELELNIPVATGIYFLRISDGNSQNMKRFVIEK